MRKRENTIRVICNHPIMQEDNKFSFKTILKEFIVPLTSVLAIIIAGMSVFVANNSLNNTKFQWYVSHQPDLIIDNNGRINVKTKLETLRRKIIVKELSTSENGDINEKGVQYNDGFIKKNFFTFELINKGMGKAVDVNLEYYLDTLAFEERLHELKIEINKKNIFPQNIMTSTTSVFGTTVEIEQDHEEDLKFYFKNIFPEENSSRNINLKLPINYFKYWSLLSLFRNVDVLESIGKYDSEWVNIPPLFLKITYKDINNNLFEKNFKISLIDFSSTSFFSKEEISISNGIIDFSEIQ